MLFDGIFDKFTSDSDSVYVMPEGKVKEKVDYMISQCRNSPYSALALCLMALSDCYSTMAKEAHAQNNMEKFQNFFNQKSPINLIVHRFVEHFEGIRQK